ncbi:nitrilase-related carbon-nitrogen hydrolase [Clostridium sp.]|uniref:nitrilase-related carbon-nitrogen hydrolase n=1 Tax=Clostridium sp. TaxID=1506 RepID=UPI0032175414
MKIGLVQNNILWENKQFNLSASKEFFKKAKDLEIDLLLFPELSFTGFTMNVEKLKEFDFSTITYISSLCKSYGINAGIGYIQGITNDKKGRNNYAIISSSGNILCNYSKIHPFSYGDESKYYTGGDEICFAQIDDITLSPFICYDLRFPEIFQIASKKCDLITVAANWPEARKEHWITLLRSRAIENQCYIAGVNRIGIGNNIIYSGNSLIIDPLGKIICSIDEGVEDILVTDINRSLVSRVRTSFKVKEDRRESLYDKLKISNA